MPRGPFHKKKHDATVGLILLSKGVMLSSWSIIWYHNGTQSLDWSLECTTDRWYSTQLLLLFCFSTILRQFHMFECFHRPNILSANLLHFDPIAFLQKKAGIRLLLSLQPISPMGFVWGMIWDANYILPPGGWSFELNCEIGPVSWSSRVPPGYGGSRALLSGR